MDYSASIHETDDPAGASPWGNSPTSSPRPSAGPLGGGFSDDPPALNYSPQPSNGFGQDVESPQAGGFQRPGTATTSSETEVASEPTTAGDDAAPSSQENDDPSAPAGAQPQQQQPAAPQEAPKPPKPQYRLQAKVVGLERTGKKDPVIRFDVYVRLGSAPA